MYKLKITDVVLHIQHKTTKPNYFSHNE